MELKMEWQGKNAFSGKTPSGHTLMTDTEEEKGGENRGTRPMEMLLGALVGSTGTDIITILKKMDMVPKDLQIEANGEMAENHPKRFTTIWLHYSFWGELTDNVVIRAIELSINKYCAVAYSLNAKIAGSYSINGGEKKRIELETGGK